MNQVVYAPARIDTRNIGEFEGAIKEALGPEVTELTIDFAETRYISSVGLRALFKTQKAMKARGGSLTITNVDSNVMDVFEVTGYTGILNFA